MSLSDRERTALLTACAFAKVFLDAADVEVRAQTTAKHYPGEMAQDALVRCMYLRNDAAKHLIAALLNIQHCTCGHMFIRHEGDTGGHCMDCECLCFAER